MRLLLIMLGSCLLWACSGPQDFSNMNAENLVSGLEVKSLTSKDQTPGIYSKLRKIRDYRITLDGEFLEECRVIGLHVDSVLVPLSVIKNGEQSMDSQIIAKGNKGSFLFTGNRQFYNSEAPDRGMETVIYQAMSASLEQGHACLLVESHGQNVCISLGEIEVLEPVFAP